jgi:hypothetical protein
MWVNLTGTESTAEDNLEVLRNGAKLHLERCYAPEAVVWHSHDCLYQSRASNLETLKGGMTNLKKMRFKNRRVHTFEGGFVQQHTLFVTHPDDFVGQMDVCFVAFVRDSMISRAYEYFDTGQIEKFLPARTGSQTGPRTGSRTGSQAG